MASVTNVVFIISQYTNYNPQLEHLLSGLRANERIFEAAGRFLFGRLFKILLGLGQIKVGVGVGGFDGFLL